MKYESETIKICVFLSSLLIGAGSVTEVAGATAVAATWVVLSTAGILETREPVVSGFLSLKKSMQF